MLKYKKYTIPIYKPYTFNQIGVTDVFINADKPIYIPYIHGDTIYEKSIKINGLERNRDYMYPVLCTTADPSISAGIIIKNYDFSSKMMDIAFDLKTKKQLQYGTDIKPESDVLIFYFTGDKRRDPNQYIAELLSITDNEIIINYNL